MILPSSLGVFVRTTQAKLYNMVQEQASATTTTTAVDASTSIGTGSDSFGLGGVWNPNTEELTITIAALDEGIDFGSVVSGTVGIYRILDAASDYLVTEIALSTQLLLAQPVNTSLKMWTVRCGLEIPPDEQSIACTLTLSDSTVTTAWCLVVTSELSQVVRHYVEQFRPSLDALDTHEERFEIPEQVVEEDTDAISTMLKFDFTQSDDAVQVIGDATITYAGGGNRYLPGQDSDTADTSDVSDTSYSLQTTGIAPWTIPARLFMECAAHNYISDPKQALGLWSIDNKSSITTIPEVFSVPAMPGYNAHVFAVSGSLTPNNTWEYKSELVPLSKFVATASTNAPITGSVLLETTTDNLGNTAGTIHNKLTYTLGLRYSDTVGSVLHETVVDLVDGMSVLGIASITDISSVATTMQTYPTAVSVCLFIRISEVYPGDRFTVTIVAPQLEDGAIASSRITGNAVRLADSVTVMSDSAGSYDAAYGLFTVVLFPSYQGIPGIAAGAQTLFDTRNPTEGFWCKQLATGAFEFGCVDADSNTYLVTTPVISLPTTSTTTVKCWFTNNRLRCSVNNSDTTQALTTDLVVPDMPSIRLGRNALDSENFNGELTSFLLEVRSLDAEEDTAVTDTPDWF